MGSKLTLVVTGRAVIPGYSLHDANVSLMLLPGAWHEPKPNSTDRESIGSSVMNTVASRTPR
jgi:hypothetical protein